MYCLNQSRSQLTASPSAARSVAPQLQRAVSTAAYKPLGTAKQKAANVASHMVAGVIGVSLIFAAAPDSSFAARSGARMGGRNFGSRSSMPRSSFPNSRSQQPGFQTGPMNQRAPSVYMQPPVVAGPRYFMSPFAYSVPFYGGYVGGYASPMFGFPPIFFAMALFALAARTMASNFGKTVPNRRSVVPRLFGWGGGGGQEPEYDEVPCTVAKVQVGLLSSARELQKDLERMASTIDTSEPAGLSQMLQETVLAVMRNPEYVEFGFASRQQFEDYDRAEQTFNEFSLAERGKFKEETLSNVEGSKRQKDKEEGQSDGKAEVIVVTIIVAAEGAVNFPNIVKRDDLKSVLSKLGAVQKDSMMACEVLWTPPDENSSYTRDEMMLDYPFMVTL